MPSRESSMPSTPSEVFMAELMPKQEGKFKKAQIPEVPDAIQDGKFLFEGREVSSAEDVQAAVKTPLNQELNGMISSAKLSEEHRPLVDALGYARSYAEWSKQAEDYQLNSDAEISEEAKQLIQGGETAESLLAQSMQFLAQYEQIKAESKNSIEYESSLTQARTDYINQLMKKPGIRGRNLHKERLIELEARYNQAFANKLSKIMELDPQHEKAPYAASMMRDIADLDVTNIRNLSERQLHMLVDQLAREKLTKAEMIEQLSNRRSKKVMKAFTNSRLLRVSVGGAIWAGGIIAANKNILPANMQQPGEVLDHVLPLAAGYFTSREVLQGINDGVDKFLQNRKMKNDIETITNDTFLTDLSLRTAYGSVEYMNGQIEGRQPGLNPEDNQTALDNINPQFTQLQNEGHRGGKPYKSEDIMPFVADLYLRRLPQITELSNAEDPKAAFIGLCTEVISENSRLLREKMSQNRAKRAAMRGLAVGLSVFAGQWVNMANDARQAPKTPLKYASISSSSS